MAHVLKLFRAPKRRAPMEELAQAQVVTNSGLEGCAHARPRALQPRQRFGAQEIHDRVSSSLKIRAATSSTDWAASTVSIRFGSAAARAR